jgi:hypothetical protein
MSYSLEQVESTLKSVFDNGVFISTREYRANSCRVIFTHQDSSTTMPPALIAAEGSREIFLVRLLKMSKLKQS